MADPVFCRNCRAGTAMPEIEYAYRLGCHGEHCIDMGKRVFERRDTIGRAATKDDALRIVAELNTIVQNAAGK